MSENKQAVLDEAIEKSRRWRDQLHSLIDGLQIPPTERNQVATALYDLCIEHCQGIHVLIEHGICGSAIALVRPQMEAFVRGSWVANCANDSAVDGFFHQKKPPEIDRLIADLEQTAAVFAGGSLGRMKGMTWRQLCDFTHGGSLQVLARISGAEIRQSYKPEHMAQLLDPSATFSFIAAVSMTVLAKPGQLAIRLRDAYQAIYG